MGSSGSTTSSTGGSVSITSGQGSSTSSGVVTIRTSNAGNAGVSGYMSFRSGTSSSGCSGAIFVHSGAATSGKGGSIDLLVGDGNVGNGGSVVITGGKSTSNNNQGGDVTISGGQSSSSDGGHIYVSAGSGTGSSGGTGGNVVLKGTEIWVQRGPSQSSNVAAMYISDGLYMNKNVQSTAAFEADSWKFSSNKEINLIITGMTYIDGSSNQISSNGKVDFDFTANGVQLGDLIVINPATDAVSMRIKNFGSSTWNKAGQWRWMAIRAQ